MKFEGQTALGRCLITARRSYVGLPFRATVRGAVTLRLGFSALAATRLAVQDRSHGPLKRFVEPPTARDAP